MQIIWNHHLDPQYKANNPFWSLIQVNFHTFSQLKSGSLDGFPSSSLREYRNVFSSKKVAE